MDSASGEEQHTATSATSEGPRVADDLFPAHKWGENAIRFVKQATLEGRSFGPTPYKIFEACGPDQKSQEPYLFIWLHGGDMSEMQDGHLKLIQRHLGRRVFFLVPLCPQIAEDGRKFSWGLAHTKKQNKNGLGFIYGQFHQEYLDAITGLVRKIAVECRATHTILCGYSMGGFGAYQLGFHAPEIFDALVVVAGYGLGTMEVENQEYTAPQPESQGIFRGFLRECCPRLALLPVVLVIHAQSDKISSFKDAVIISDSIKSYGGNCELIRVPDDQSDSDSGRKKKLPDGHHYYKYALLNDTSVEVLYNRLQAALPLRSARAAAHNALRLQLQSQSVCGTLPRSRERSRTPQRSTARHDRPLRAR